MAACDLILAPARAEPFGRTPFEAAQAGVPIFMSSDSGAAEIMVSGQTGMLIAPDDVTPWIEETRRILNAPESATAMVRQARAALAGLSPIQHARRIEAFYRDMLARNLRAERAAA